MWEKKGLEVTMPPVDDYQHLVAWFHEIGPVAAGVLGTIPVSYQEMAAWAEMTGTEIDTWEAWAVRRMSEQYCFQAHISESARCPAPFQMGIDDTGMAEMRKAADAKLRSMW